MAEGAAAVAVGTVVVADAAGLRVVTIVWTSVAASTSLMLVTRRHMGMVLTSFLVSVCSSVEVTTLSTGASVTDAEAGFTDWPRASATDAEAGRTDWPKAGAVSAWDTLAAAGDTDWVRDEAATEVGGLVVNSTTLLVIVEFPETVVRVWHVKKVVVLSIVL